MPIDGPFGPERRLWGGIERDMYRSGPARHPSLVVCRRDCDVVVWSGPDLYPVRVLRVHSDTPNGRRNNAMHNTNTHHRTSVVTESDNNQTLCARSARSAWR